MEFSLCMSKIWQTLPWKAVYSKENYVIDAVGPDSYTFKELVQMVGETIGAKRLLISVPPRLALLAAQFLSLFVKDVLLTPEEVDGLMANLLVSKEPARARTVFRDWLNRKPRNHRRPICF
jgi:uncharacterized protein YbjT (DUF2867 family)